MILVLGLEGKDADAFRRSAALAHVPNGLSEVLNESNSAAIFLRLSLARVHADEKGRIINPALLAKKTGKTALGIARALATGYDRDGELAVAAASLGVDREWILYGTNDPKWYRDSLAGISLPTDPAWESERKRLKSGGGR